jgi:sugar lactone lactonase YvrE
MTPKAVSGDSRRGRSEEHQGVRRLRRVLAGVLVILTLLLFAAFFMLLRAFEPVGEIASTTETRGIAWVQSIYGWGNAPDQQLGSPQSVAVGPDGLIWVTDAGISRVVSFKPDGTYNSVLDQGPRGSEGAFSFPSSVAVDEAGLIYVGDMTASSVVVLTADNKVVRRISVPRPMSVAVRGDRLVVGSTPGFVIMSKTGDVVKVLGSKGTGDDQFSGVAGIAISPNGTIYVVDQYNNRVSAYDTNGTRLWIRQTGNPGNQTTPGASMTPTASVGAGMQLPSGIAIDGAGRLAVVDAFGFNVVMLDPSNGNPIGDYGDAGTKDGTFVYPSAIAYDPQRDWFLVADTSMNRVQVIRIPGSEGSFGGTVVATVNRALIGPVRAILIPVGLLVLIIIGWFVYRWMRRRRSRAAAADAGAAEDDGAVASEDYA